MDNVVSLMVLLIVATVGSICFLVKVTNDQEKRKKENDRYWDEFRWGN